MKFEIHGLDNSRLSRITQIINSKTKPPGSLGMLESLATQLALITGPETITLSNPSLLVFAGDHGIALQGVSTAPQSVTRQMVLNFLDGGAAINCFTQLNGLNLKIIDTGITEAVQHDGIISQRLGSSTGDISTEAAMSTEQLTLGFTYARALVEELHGQNCNIIGIGEMGIGNSSSAAAVMAAVLGLSADECVGLGTGITSTQRELKCSLVKQALQRHRHAIANPLELLAALGGFEIVQMTATILYSAERGMAVLIDGFIATAAALVAYRINPAAKQYMIFCHTSGEHGHQKMLQYFGATPLLDLNMRLGEGTGAALAMNLVYAAQSFYNDMASFDSAGVQDVRATTQATVD